MNDSRQQVSQSGTQLENTHAQQLAILRQQVATLQSNSDDFFLITMGMVIFFMQCGFAFIECGSVRTKNTINILIKNLLDSFCAGLSYWLIGFPLAFGDRDPVAETEPIVGEAFGGNRYWASYGLGKERFSFWFFQFVFAATASTIVSGAVAERCEFGAYLIYSFAVTGVLYPIVTHWCWSPLGWLASGANYVIDGVETNIAYSDFAGSGVVHLVGGVAALVGAAFLGPRLHRFDKAGRPRDIKGHSVPMAALGGFILLFGFIAFNGGSQASISQPGDGPAVAVAIVNTVISGSFAAFVGLIMGKLPVVGTGHWSLLTTLNSTLAGFVAICAGCNQFEPWAAAFVGAIAAPIYRLVSAAVLRVKIDDPLDAVAVHAGGGVWGVVTVALFAPDSGVLYNWDRQSGLVLMWQMIGLGAIFAWSGGASIVTFGCLYIAGILRVDDETQTNGTVPIICALIVHSLAMWAFWCCLAAKKHNKENRVYSRYERSEVGSTRI